MLGAGNDHAEARGYSLIGKTAILHIVNLGSTPDFSIETPNYLIKYLLKG